MTKKRYKERAAAVASAAGSFAILASVDEKVILNRQTALTSFKCSACATDFKVNAALDDELVGIEDPFCPNCGSEETEQVGESMVEDVKVDEYSALRCPHCNTANVISDKVTAALQGTVHCVCCGSDITYVAAAENHDLDENDLTEDLDEEVAGKQCAADDTEDENPDTVDTNDEGDQQVAGDDTEEDNDEGDSELEEVDLVQAYDDDEVEGFRITQEEDQALAFLGDVCVARLAYADAGAHQDLFYSPTFARAISHQVASQGLKQALASFNFTPVKVKLSLAKLIAAKVEAQLTAERAKVEAKAGDLEADYSQCLSLASVALTKGFYKNRHNPLVAALASELGNLGVRNPGNTLKRIMANAGLAYNRELLALAKDFMTKPLEFRNELAATLDDMETQVEGEVDESEEDTEIGARLEGASLRPTTTTPKSKVTANSNGSPYASLIAQAQASGGLFGR